MRPTQYSSKLALAALFLSAVALPVTTIPASAGNLVGHGGHKASGSARVVGSSVKLGSNFRFDGGPDVYVAIKGKNNKLKLLGKLRKNSGAQSYRLPKGSKGADISKVHLWCKQYSVSLGSASAK